MRHRLAVVVLAKLCVLMACDVGLSAPSISGVTALTSTVGLYDVFAVTFSVQTCATNPFWPYDPSPPASIPAGSGVTVDGLFSADNWDTIVTVPGFYCHDYEIQPVGSHEYGSPVGESYWCVRFSPKTTGTWQYKLRVQDASGTTTYPEMGGNSFECTESQSGGFLRVSRSDSRYFETSEGRSVPTVGINANLETISQADALLKTCGENGVNVVRWFMNYRGWQNPFGGGDTPVAGGPQWDFTLSMSTDGGAKAGDRYAGYLTTSRNTHQTVMLTKGRLYRYTGFVRTSAVTASPGGGVIAYLGSATATALTGTNDWSAFSIDLTPSASGEYAVGVKHTGSGGTGYFDDLSLRYSTDGGNTWSGECLRKGDMDFQNYVDLIEARKADLIFEAARTHGVYLKTVISESADASLCCISPDGSTGAKSNNNYYASADHPSRWLQKAWWRYMTARWGCYTSLHSWELCNEGDPFNGNHWDAATALADYVHSVDPNRAMCTTSFWHSVPMRFWRSSSCDYLDVHEYIGPTTPGTISRGPRFYAWTDPLQSASNAVVNTLTVDESVCHSGARSYKITAPMGDSEKVDGYAQYHVGVDPSHTYTLKYWAKADSVGNQGGGLSWTRPGVMLVWSVNYHENDYISSVFVDADLGTYDWTQIIEGSLAPPATANTINIQPRCTCSPDQIGYFWIDDVELIDETTGESLYIDGGFEGDRIDYDTALGVRKFGMLLDSYRDRLGKPAVWGETGIRGPNAYGSVYRGYRYTEENQQLVDDNDGIYIKKMVWAHVGPNNPNMIYWWTDNIQNKGLWRYSKAFQSFMSGTPLSNGHYRDARAVTGNAALRAWGQKDLTANRAHLWIDNAPYTWKAVVDHNYRPEPWSSAATYANGSTCGSGTPMHIYRSLQDNNKNHPVTDTAWWEDTGEFDPSKNPPLPPPVSGTVTVSGFEDRRYKIEWWDTSTGEITSTEEVQCLGGDIVLSVRDLQSDVACKIQPLASKLDVRLRSPSDEVLPGEIVTVTVEYTNSDSANAPVVTVEVGLPEGMDYVEGSAEESGGRWDPTTGKITWTILDLPAGQTGTKTFRGKIR